MVKIEVELSELGNINFYESDSRGYDFHCFSI